MLRGEQWSLNELAKARALAGERVLIALLHPYAWLDRYASQFPGFLFEVHPMGLVPRATRDGKLVPIARRGNVPRT